MSAPDNLIPSAPKPVYRIRDLSKAYAGRRVLDIQSLDIYPGEVLALVGPSGSGKSTLLRLLNFLEHPSDGEIVFADFAFKAGLAAPLELRRRVTTVFQKPMLLDRSVWENIVFGLHLRGQKGDSPFARQVLEDVGLGALVHQRASTLSSGEAQRVALARAMVIQPEVLLLDEPTANLDPYNVNLIETIVRDLNQKRKTTLVLVTHNVFQAQRMAHRVAFLLDGQIVETADNLSFFNRPKDPRTRAFISGEMVY